MKDRSKIYTYITDHGGFKSVEWSDSSEDRLRKKYGNYFPFCKYGNSLMRRKMLVGIINDTQDVFKKWKHIFESNKPLSRDKNYGR